MNSLLSLLPRSSIPCLSRPCLSREAAARRGARALALASSLALALLGAAPAHANVDRAAALALDSTAAFERATASARQISSGGGNAVTRAELRHAIGFFQHDDGVISTAERTCLANFLADPAAQEALSGAARKYAVEFLELNAELPPAPVAVSDLQASLVDLFGAAGALTSSVWLQEARVTSGGAVISQATLRSAYGRAFGGSAGTFDPINVRELVNELSGRLELGTPAQDEVDGVVAYLTQGPKAASRLYLASWIAAGRGADPGDLGGVVIAAVSNDRRTVRFLEVHGWTE